MTFARSQPNCEQQKTALKFELAAASSPVPKFANSLSSRSSPALSFVTLSHTVADLAEQQKLTSVELRGLSHTVADLADTVRTLHIRTDKTAGWALEWVVGNRLPAYVGHQIKRCRVVGPMDVIESLEDRPAIRDLSDEDLDQLRRADLIASGVIDDERIYLVGEVSFTADNDDVLRAARRAGVLRKVGERSQPFVACDAIGSISAELARREGVWIIVEGRLLAPAA
jgi:hypothetical protein